MMGYGEIHKVTMILILQDWKYFNILRLGITREGLTVV
jgi:hypothetical protein